MSKRKYSELGQSIVEHLWRIGGTKKDLAKYVGVNRSTLYAWLYGVTSPRQHQMVKICEYLKLVPQGASLEEQIMAQLKLQNLEEVKVPQELESLHLLADKPEAMRELIMKEIARVLAKHYLGGENSNNK